MRTFAKGSLKIIPSINKIHPLVWHVICLVLSIVVYIAILENRSPNFLRPLSVSLRTSFGVTVLAATLAMYVVYRIPGKFGQLTGMAATLALFAMPLAGLWVSGFTQSILISGLIPVSDASNYYIDALRIQNGMDISSFSAMRPIFSGFLAFLLSMTGRNLMSALGILTALMGLAAYIATREIQRTHGTEPAILFLLSMFLYFRHHSGTTLSESLGVTVSLLGIALLWQGKDEKKERLVFLGLIMAAFALTIRPGAMFVLPAFVLWGGWYFRGNGKFSSRFLVFGAMAVASVFFLNSVMIKILAGPGGVAFANFSWALYGLASGGNSWTYIFQVHPEVFSLGAQEQNRAIYKLAIDLILQNPSLLVQGALQYWRIFFSSTWYNAFSFVAGQNYFVNEFARWGLYVLCGMGFVKWWKDRNDEYASLVGLAALGVLASVPFVPPTDAYRVRLYAATIPIFGLLPAMGVAYLRDWFNLRYLPNAVPYETQKTNLGIPYSILLIATLLIPPALIKINGYPPIIEAASCPSDMDGITVRYDAGTYVNVTRENKVYLDWMPDFHISAFRRNSHSLADINLIQVMESITPASTLFSALDIQTNQAALVIIKTDELPEAGQVISLCGQWDKNSNVENYGIFHASLLAGK